MEWMEERDGGKGGEMILSVHDIVFFNREGEGRGDKHSLRKSD